MTELPPEIASALERLAELAPQVHAAVDSAMETFREVETRLNRMSSPAFVMIGDTNDSLVYCRYGSGDKSRYRFCIRRDGKIISVDEAETGLKLAAFAELPRLLKIIVQGYEGLLRKP